MVRPRRARRARRPGSRRGRLIVLVGAALAFAMPAHPMDPALMSSSEPAPTTATAPSPGPSPAPTAIGFGGLPAVGALFLNGTGGDHGCTASVVRSPTGDLVLTAAHCLIGNGAGVQFAPMYHDGVSPYGVWDVQQIYADPGWVLDQDPRHDYAFVRVAPQVRAGRLTNVQDVVGGNRLETADVVGERVQVVGYSVGVDDDPVTCVNQAYAYQGYVGFDCHGYADGTSGAPWLLPGPVVSGIGADHDAAVVGLIGGLNQGGCEEASSYSARFGADILRVYQRAVNGVGPDTLRPAGGSGC